MSNKKMYKGVHPLKKRFKDLNIPQIQLSRKFNVRYFTLNFYLNGYIPLPKELEEKMNNYADELERERG